MELGNMIFGNSRGSFSLERHCGFEGQLQRLFMACTKDDKELDYNLSYGMEFENDCFSLFPYYWGDCTCGFDDAEIEWSRANDHKQDCYQYCVINNLIQSGWNKTDGWYSGYRAAHPEDMDYDEWAGMQDRVRQEFCEDMGLPYPNGGAIHCTCDYNKRYKEWHDENDHKSDCPTIRPNFLHKRTGISINWYKYPLRDSYISMDISLRDFSKIIDECCNSVDKQS